MNRNGTRRDGNLTLAVLLMSVVFAVPLAGQSNGSSCTASGSRPEEWNLGVSYSASSAVCVGVPKLVTFSATVTDGANAASFPADVKISVVVYYESFSSWYPITSPAMVKDYGFVIPGEGGTYTASGSFPIQTDLVEPSGLYYVAITVSSSTDYGHTGNISCSDCYRTFAITQASATLNVDAISCQLTPTANQDQTVSGTDPFQPAILTFSSNLNRLPGWSYAYTGSPLALFSHFLSNVAHATPGYRGGTYTITATCSNYGLVKTSATITATRLPACTTNATLALFDPVPLPPDYKTSAVEDDHVKSGLSAGTFGNLRTITGVAADGVAQAVVNISGCSNTTYSLYLLDEAGNDPSDYRNTVGDLAQNDGSTIFSGKLPSVKTDSSGFAVVVYRAPADFPRGPQDNASTNRSVILRVARGGTVELSQSITIERPPIILVHGLWGDRTAWNEFADFRSDNRFFVRLVEYGLPIGIAISTIGTTPTYTRAVLNQATGSSLGFAYGANVMLTQLGPLLNEYRTIKTVGATQFDIVAHSMGGMVTRTMEKLPSFYSTDNFERGKIHKVITIGTPHQGSPLATELLAKSGSVYLNGCVQRRFAEGGAPAFETVAGVAYGSTGGVADLRPGSPAIARLSSTGAAKLPTAVIAGEMTQAQLERIDDFRAALWLIRNVACLGSGDPALSKIDAAGWPTMMGGASDGIVGAVSARNGRSSATLTYSAIHSGGTADLGFEPPHLLQGGVQAGVASLLNVPISQSSVFQPIAQ